MLTYLQRLLNERDQLTATATSIADAATERNEDLTDTERATLANIAERCAQIDAQIETYNAQAESTRAYARLRSAVTLAEDHADNNDDNNDAGNHNNGHRNGHQQRGGQIERRDVASAGWADPFVRSGVLETYTGHGSSTRVELGPVVERSAPGGMGVITTQTPPPDVVSPMRWTPPTPTWQYRLLDVVNVVPTTFGAVDWVRYQPTQPPDAPEVAEGDLKPEMPLSIELRSDTLKTDAHHKVITRQALQDLPAIRQEIETRLRAGVMAKMQTRVATALTGDTSIPATSGDSLLAGIRVAIGAMDDTAGYTPNAVVLNPGDWATIDLTLLGQTLAGAIVNGGSWGLTFVSSSKIPAGTAYVGDFRAGVTLFQRATTEVFVTDSHVDYFLRNQLVLLAETRAFAAVTEPMALMQVTATAPAPPPPSG